MSQVERNEASSVPVEPQSEKARDVSVEKHYSIQDLAIMWKLSEKTVRKLFENEPGVIEIGSSEARFKRGYVTRRIPESVAERVHRRLRKSA